MKRVIAFLLLACLSFATRAADPDRSLQTSSPATGVSQVTLEAGVGQLKVSPSADDNLHVQVTLVRKSENFLWFFHWMSQSTVKAISQISLQQQLQSGTLVYSLKYPDHLDDGDVKQNWDVQVPARLAIKISMKVGQLAVNGIGGGVDASLNVGEMTLNIPGGPMKATVNVGQIRATSGSKQPGNIRLSTSIGDARLYMNGWSNRHNDVHRNGLGSSIDVSGKGPDSMQLEINIGEVTLHIDPAQHAGHSH